MERKQRRRFVWLAGFTVAALVVATLLILARPKPLPPLPSPNGYDSFVQAGTLVSSDVGDFARLGHDALRQLIATNSESLRLLRLGLSQRCAVPMNFAQTDYTNFLANMTRPLAKMKSLAYLLAAEGRLAELNNRPGDAARSYIECIRFGNEQARGGMLINHLVGMACEGIGYRPLLNVLPKLDVAELRELTYELDEICRDRVPWEEVVDIERRFNAHAGRQSGQPRSWTVAQWRYLPTARQFQEKDLRITTQLSLLTTELALRCYQAENGKPPTQLKELSPDFLKDIPPDPFNGKPLVYRPQGTNWLLYSVGPDGADDRGIPIARNARTVKVGLPFFSVDVPTGDVFYDSSW